MTPKSYSERKREERAAANNEFTGVVFTILSAFVLLCLFTRDLILGVIGGAISGFLLGFIGYFSYPLFLFLLVVGVLKIKNRQVTASAKTIVLIVLSVFLALSIAHLASSAKHIGNGYGAYLSASFESKDTVGGLLFSIVTYAFYKLFKFVASYIILSILLLLSVAFLASSLMSAKNKSAKRSIKKSKFIKTTHSTGSAVLPSSNGGLFVGQIVKALQTQGTDEESFDDMEETTYPIEDERPYSPEMPEEEYKRLRSREILFGQAEGFSYSQLPSKAVSAPDVKRSQSPVRKAMPAVPIPAPKDFEYNYVEGEIINGDAVSEAALRKEIEAPAVEESEKQFVALTPKVDSVTPSAPTPQETYFNDAPIINGDYYAQDKSAAQFYFERPVVEEAPTQDTNFDVVDESVASDYQTYDETNESELSTSDEYIAEEVIDETVFYEEPTTSPIVDFTFDEETEADNNEEPLFEDLVSEEVDEEDETVDYTDEEELFEEETTSNSYDEEYEELTQEIIEEDSFEETDVEEIVENETIVDDSSSEFVAEEDDEAKRARELSARFDATTTSFNIVEEVEDKSETHFDNPNDTTGYYKTVSASIAPVAPPKPTFESRVEDIDKKINSTFTSGSKPIAEQMDIDSFVKDSARKQRENAVAEEKPKPIKKPKKYVPPPLELLVTESTQPEMESDGAQENIDKLEQCLSDLGVPAKVNGVTVGPAITRYEMDMPAGMSVRRIENMADDIRYALASKGLVRIESPIPGKRAVGIEVPNATIFTVALKDIIGAPEFKASSSPLTIALGKDIQGKVMCTCLDKMPHLLIAGATGSGKSSCLNSLLISLMYKASPSDVRLILIDPKRVEFTAYNGLPHMLIENAITDVKRAIAAFKWACDEMERRYGVLQMNCVRDIKEYNSMSAVKEGTLPKMHYIVIVVDELANLIMSSKLDKKTLEDSIVTLASKARAAGIHLVLATQRPSVEVVTGTIKANLPSRIAFAVSTMADSRVILDGGGAETLLGRGDMLYAPLNESEETRIQGAFVENFEVKQIVDFVKENNPADFDEEFCEAIEPKESSTGSSGGKDEESSQYDKELPDVVRLVIKSGKASSAHIQRRFRFGWNKAARIMEQMEELNFVGPQEGGAKSREIYITPEKFEEFFGEKFDQS